METMFLPIVLLGIGLLLVVLELFIPSAGVIGIVAAIVIFVAIVFAFMADAKQGFVFLLVTSILVPLVLIGMVKVWPHTPIGKRMFGRLPTEEEVIPNPEQLAELNSLIGKQGVARSKMLPSGVVRVDGKNYDAVSNGIAVDEGQKVIVIAVRTNRMIVKPVSTVLLDPGNTDNVLAQSPESLGIDSQGIEPPGIEPIDAPLGKQPDSDSPTIEDPFS